ncbi:hypothetical protein C8F01DRAFT_1255523 [Mycena amicta]|nr:hypothetical protein C8F01DRAFT_1255523 [Mycena amicta]
MPRAARKSTHRSTVPYASKKAPTKKQNLACEFPDCTWSFKRASDLTRHQTQHLTPEEREARMHKCDWENCTFQALQRTNLLTHLNTHTGAKPFQCDYCPYRAADRSCVNKHQRMHHPDEEAAAPKTKRRSNTGTVKRRRTRARSPSPALSEASYSPTDFDLTGFSVSRANSIASSSSGSGTLQYPDTPPSAWAAPYPRLYLRSPPPIHTGAETESFPQADLKLPRTPRIPTILYPAVGTAGSLTQGQASYSLPYSANPNHGLSFQSQMTGIPPMLSPGNYTGPSFMPVVNYHYHSGYPLHYGYPYRPLPPPRVVFEGEWNGVS